jgi:hypothetical protein
VCGEESPHVEIFDAVRFVDEVQGRTLAQSYADEPVLEHRVVGLSREEIREIRARDLRQMGQIVAIYRFVGAVDMNYRRLTVAP